MNACISYNLISCKAEIKVRPFKVKMLRRDRPRQSSHPNFKPTPLIPPGFLLLPGRAQSVHIADGWGNNHSFPSLPNLIGIFQESSLGPALFPIFAHEYLPMLLKRMSYSTLTIPKFWSQAKRTPSPIIERTIFSRRLVPPPHGLEVMPGKHS